MKTKMTLASLLVLMTMSLSPKLFAAGEYPAVNMEFTEFRPFHSDRLERDFRLMIAKPFRPPASSSGRYPVIYLLDADIAFPMVRQIAMSLQGGNELPPVVIVGIGYPGGFREAVKYRTLDYTPSVDAGYLKFAARWEGIGDKVRAGGAKAFLSFIREELKPFVEKHYKVDKNDATFFGSSFGGLFGAYVLLHEHDTFQRYILSSPSLWWDRLAMFEAEKRLAEKGGELPAKVFLGVGGRENRRYEEVQAATAPAQLKQSLQDFVAMVGEHAQMLEVVKPFVAQLKSRNYKNLLLRFHVFPEDTHASTPPLSITRGLRVVFGTF